MLINWSKCCTVDLYCLYPCLLFLSVGLFYFSVLFFSPLMLKLFILFSLNFNMLCIAFAISESTCSLERIWLLWWNEASIFFSVYLHWDFLLHSHYLFQCILHTVHHFHLNFLFKSDLKATNDVPGRLKSGLVLHLSLPMVSCTWIILALLLWLIIFNFGLWCFSIPILMILFGSLIQEWICPIYRNVLSVKLFLSFFFTKLWF